MVLIKTIFLNCLSPTLKTLSNLYKGSFFIKLINLINNSNNLFLNIIIKKINKIEIIIILVK